MLLLCLITCVKCLFGVKVAVVKGKCCKSHSPVHESVYAPYNAVSTCGLMNIHQMREDNDLLK